MTYYVENRKSSEENEKRSFGRATLLEKKWNAENSKVKGRKGHGRNGTLESDELKL